MRAHVCRPPGQWVSTCYPRSQDIQESHDPAWELKEHQMAGEVGPLRWGLPHTARAQPGHCCGQISQDGHPAPYFAAPAQGCIPAARGAAVARGRGQGPPQPWVGPARWSAKQALAPGSSRRAVGRARNPRAGGRAGVHRGSAMPLSGSQRGTPSSLQALSPAHMRTLGTPSSVCHQPPLRERAS